MTTGDVGLLTMTYTSPDGTVTVRRLSMDRWDALHDRLEAQGMCAAADRRLDEVIKHAQEGAATVRMIAR